MIHFTCNSESFTEGIRTYIDPVMNTDIYFHISRNNDNNNIIYNAIKDNITGKTCYPDMIIRHNFTESDITDNNMYIIADDAIRRFGSSRCFFVSVCDINSLSGLIASAKAVFDASDPVISQKQLQYIRDFGEKLMLSATMMHSFISLMTYYRETGGDIPALLAPFGQEYPLPVSTKTEGKKIYELIRNQILG